MAGQYVASQPQRIQQEVEAGREIQIQGYGEIEARPNIGHVRVGVTIESQSTAENALRLLSEKFDRIVKAVEGVGVAEEDITTTDFQINPQYDYSDGRQILRGFGASETVQIKVRDLDTISDVIAKATAEGSNQVGGVTFESEEQTELEKRAQEVAIADARQKAQELARALGVQLGKVKFFSASPTQPPVQPYLLESVAKDTGGDLPGPPIRPGSQTVTSTVTVTYEIK